MVKNSPANARNLHKRHGVDPWAGKVPWRKAWQPAPVFLPGESCRQRSLAGYSLWGRKESDTIEATEQARARKQRMNSWVGGPS